MDTDTHGLKPDLTEAIIGSAFEIANVLGAGFLEKIYERALIRELALRGISAKAQVSFPVSYKGQYLGEYMADLVVEGKIIVELKCVDRLSNEHRAQCINYLKASGIGVGDMHRAFLAGRRFREREHGEAFAVRRQVQVRGPFAIRFGIIKVRSPPRVPPM